MEDRAIIMRKILDKLFQNKKASIIVPITVAAICYILFIIFSKSADKVNEIIATPIACLVWFFGLFLIIYFQVKNPICPEWFLNILELLVVFVFCIPSVFDLVSFITSGFQNFNLGMCLCLVSYSATALAHSKRAKQ